jgi:histidinol-phosphate aminotransferase
MKNLGRAVPDIHNATRRFRLHSGVELHRHEGPEMDQSAAPQIATESPLGPFESALAAAMSEVSSANMYPEAGFGSLRQDLATHHTLPLEHVAAGAGSSSLIHHLSVALLHEGTNIVTAGPTGKIYGREALKRGAAELQIPLGTDGASDLPAMLLRSTTRPAWCT